jgi:rhodanese-related sulfurtransferase
MTPQRIAAKFFASPDPGGSVDLQPFIPLFHRFIQQGSVEGLLVDVADYAHVPEGPGIILIGHDVDYGIDLSGGRAGLLTTRKRYGDAPTPEILRDTLRKALIAIRAIEADGSTGLRFATEQLDIRFLDRLAVPNTEEAFAAVAQEITPILRELFCDANLEVSRVQAESEHASLAAMVRTREAADADALLQRLGAADDREALRPGSERQSDWEIGAGELKKLRDERADFVLIDVREPHEYQICNLGGELIPLRTLGGKLGDLDRTAHIVVHCQGGGRGASAVSTLRGAGFENAWHLRGGILAWIEEIDPSLTRY